LDFDSIRPQGRKSITKEVTSNKPIRNIVYHRRNKLLVMGKISKKTIIKLAILVATSCLIIALGSLYRIPDKIKDKVVTKPKKSIVSIEKTVAETPVLTPAPVQVAEPVSVVGNNQLTGTTNNILLTNYYLEVPKLNIFGNILETDSMEKVDSMLKNGVVHLPGTVNPGNIGNTMFTAHSSYYDWDYYSHIFAKINNLENEDKIIIHQNNVLYSYKVFKKEVITAELEAVKYVKGEENIVLLTCWPVGTSQYRLAVYGKRIK